MDSTQSPGIVINQIYLNRALLEHSPASASFPADIPVGDHQLTVTVTTGVSEDGKQGAATVTVQTTPENVGVYRFVVEMVAIVSALEGQENMPIAQYVATILPASMYPFLREAVA